MDSASIAHSMKTIFQLSVEKSSYENGCHGHLRTLSIYARTMASCRNGQSYETMNHSWGYLNPSNVEKKEEVTSCESTSKKRRLDDSCLDDTYETPARKLWKPQNNVNPLPEPHLGSSGPKIGSSTGKNSVVDHEEGRTAAGSGLMVKHVKSEWSDGGQAGMIPGRSHPAQSELEELTEDQDTAFDADIAGIMCLSPINSDSSYDSMDEFISSCLSVYEQSLSDKKDRGHVVFGRRLIGSTLECQVEEVNLENSSQNPLPLQVQVSTQSEDQSPPQPPEVQRKVPCQHKGSNTKHWKATKSRPVVFDTEQVWQKEKRLYMDSVSHHMQESVGAGQGVITELVNLMDHVADQGPDWSGQLWQHPSDLTSRNYKVCFGSLKTMTLDQWADQSLRNDRRFVTVPKVFKRNRK